MLQSLNPLQDENSQPYSVGIRQGLDTGKRFAGNAANTPLGKPAGLSSARKALGNITNRSTFQHDNATPFKATPAMPGPRKKLGDITNATPAKPGQLAKTLLEKSKSQGKPKPAKQRSKAEIYAEDGIEILAGSSGQQLEAGRQLRDLTDAKTKAAYVASLPAFQPPAMRRSRGVLDMLSSVDLEVLEPPPSPTSLHPSTDDLLEFQSPSSILAEISSGDLDVLSDLESDDNCEQDDCNRSWDSS
ncbi:MAG: hypothetical protein FRX49_00081 [Trebouxia sp. A1-2]|nr:MAG: hypothetical protein FRX49_00081 [Trebouxia sp. A1-2]